MTLRTPVHKRGITYNGWSAALVGFPNHYQSLGLGIRQRPQDNCVNDTKDCRARPDAQGQGQDRRRRKARMLQQSTNSVAQVLPKCAHEPSLYLWDIWDLWD